MVSYRREYLGAGEQLGRDLRRFPHSRMLHQRRVPSCCCRRNGARTVHTCGHESDRLLRTISPRSVPRGQQVFRSCGSNHGSKEGRARLLVTCCAWDALPSADLAHPLWHDGHQHHLPMQESLFSASPEIVVCRPASLCGRRWS